MRLVVVALLVVAPLVATLTTFAETPGSLPRPHHHAGRGFRNPSADYSYSMALRAVHLVRRGFEREPDRGTAPLVLSNDGRALRANGQAPTVTWVGHATLLVQIDGVNVLTDPHWGERASPVGFVGPRRLVGPGLRFEDLPPIHAVVISHDHYDHLDEATVRRLAREHRPTFFVPLGIKAWLADQEIAEVVELDWWQSVRFRGLIFVCTPAQHSSGRGLHDQNLRLWSSWVVLGAKRRFYFAGDTGYWTGLRAIGERFGPFDLTAIPIGGYSTYTKRHPNHVNPEEAVQLMEDVRGRRMIPIHYGTFELNREPFAEPPDRLLREAARRGITENVTLPRPGQTLHW